MTNSRRRYGLLLGLFTLLALITTWPLITRITSHVPGSDTWAYDEYTFIWSMWWFKHSLLDLRSSIFFSQNIFYPLGMELILYSYNLLAAILALPVGVAAGWPLAANLNLLFSAISSGLGAYLLALWLLRDASGQIKTGDFGKAGNLRVARAAALIAGVIYAYASNRAIYLALGHYNIHSVQYLPFFVLYLLRLMWQPTRRNAALAGLFGALNLLVDMQYGVFMAFLGGCLLLTRPLRDWLRGNSLALNRWLGLLGAAVLSLLLVWPYFWETLKSLTRADYLLSGWGDALKLSADLVGWFTPTDLHPVWGGDWVRRLRQVQEGTAPFSDVNTVFLGWFTLALALLGAMWLWRRSRGWTLAAVLAALFTLGPLLQVRGRWLFDFDGLETSIPMPFLVLHYIPFIQGNRTANRWSIVLMLALAVLAAWGAAWLIGRLRQWGGPRTPTIAAAALAGLILFEHAALPMPLTDARIPPAVQALAAQPHGAVLQAPMGWRNSFGVLGMENTRAQYYMSAHEKPILSGNTSRNPPIKFDYFRGLPLVEAITQQEFGHPPGEELMARARAQVDDLITLWGVRYIMLLPPVPGRLPYADTWQPSQQLLLDLIPHRPAPIIDDGSIRIYAVEPGAPLPLRLDFGSQDTAPWRGAGWSVDEPDVGGAPGMWAAGRQVHLMFRAPEASPDHLQLSFRAAPFDWPNAPPQFLILRLNGRRIGQATLGPGWQEYSFAISPQPGINHLWLEFSRADSPRQVLAQAQIGATGLQAPVDIEVNSFEQAFITLSDAAGDAIPASFGRRGYNVTTLDPRSGAVLGQEGFDTVANAFEVERLIAYLHELPQGQIVILSTREGAGDFITPGLVRALRRLGSGLSTTDILPNQAHALVGVVGAAPGTAAEVIDPASAFLRISGDFRTLAAAFDWLRIE